MPKYHEEDKPRRRQADEVQAGPPRRRDRIADDDDYRPRPSRKKTSDTSGLMLLTGVCVAVLLLAVVGYGVYEFLTRESPQAAVAYNEKLLSADQRLAVAYLNFGDNVFDTDVKTVRANYQQLRQTFKTIAAEMRTWPVPRSPSGRKLHEGFEHFLQTREMDAEKLAQIPDILENKNIAANDKKVRISELLRQYESSLSAPLADLIALQKEFAREQNFVLNPASAPGAKRP